MSDAVDDDVTASVTALPTMKSYFTVGELPDHLDRYQVMSVVGDLLYEGASTINIVRHIEDLRNPDPTFGGQASMGFVHRSWFDSIIADMASRYGEPAARDLLELINNATNS